MVLPIDCGVDQGDSLAPFLFALGLPLDLIRRRIAELLRNGRGEDQGAAFAALLSYLDDLSLAVPAGLVAEARDIVIDELAKVGLEVNADKSLVFAPTGACPSGCEDW